jgi:hypothetical protein
VTHCFRNVGAGDADWVVATTPARAVTMIEELAALAPGELDRLAEALERHDSQLLEHPHCGPVSLSFWRLKATMLRTSSVPSVRQRLTFLYVPVWLGPAAAAANSATA